MFTEKLPQIRWIKPKPLRQILHSQFLCIMGVDIHPNGLHRFPAIQINRLANMFCVFHIPRNKAVTSCVSCGYPSHFETS